MTQIPRIRKAITSGNPHAVYRALWWTRTLGQSGMHRDRIAALLNQRRLFITPIRSAPALMRINGVGAAIYGDDDHDPADGTYVTTHFFTVVFVPVFPFSQYLVARAPQGKGWRFFGKVPMGPVVALWRTAVVGAVGLGVLGAAAEAWDASGHNDVVVVNGLDLPVHATLGPESLDLAPGGQQTVHMDVGAVSYTATTAGSVPLDSGTLVVERGASHTLVWNVAGLAPLYIADIVYAASESNAPTEDPKVEVHCDETQLARQDLDFVFTKPPDSIDMPEGSDRITRKQLGVADGGWKVCIDRLGSDGMLDKATELGIKVIDAHAQDDLTMRTVFSVLYANGATEASGVALARKLRDAHPDNVTIHRLYQYTLERSGQADTELTEYKAYAATRPDDADAQWLYDRLLPADQALGALRALAAAHPTQAETQSSLCAREEEQHNYAAGVAACAAFAAARPDQMINLLDAYAGALVALNRADEAISMVAATNTTQASPWDLLTRAALYARLVRQQHGDKPELLIDALKDGTEEIRPVGRLWGGGDPSADEVAACKTDTAKAAVDLYRTALSDPGKALALVTGADVAAVGCLDPDMWALLFGESIRTGNGAATDALSKSGTLSPADLKVARAWLDGRDPGPEYQAFPLSMRAAFSLVRSRTEGLPASERARLLAEAQAEDIVAGPVTWASQRWSP